MASILYCIVLWVEKIRMQVFISQFLHGLYGIYAQTYDFLSRLFSVLVCLINHFSSQKCGVVLVHVSVSTRCAIYRRMLWDFTISEVSKLFARYRTTITIVLVLWYLTGKRDERAYVFSSFSFYSTWIHNSQTRKKHCIDPDIVHIEICCMHIYKVELNIIDITTYIALYVYSLLYKSSAHMVNAPFFLQCNNQLRVSITPEFTFIQ